MLISVTEVVAVVLLLVRSWLGLILVALITQRSHYRTSLDQNSFKSFIFFFFIFSFFDSLVRSQRSEVLIFLQWKFHGNPFLVSGGLREIIEKEKPLRCQAPVIFGGLGWIQTNGTPLDSYCRQQLSKQSRMNDGQQSFNQVMQTFNISFLLFISY